MTAITALSTASTALRENTVILLAAFIISVIGELYLIGQLQGTMLLLVAGGIWFLLQPFLLGGVFGMASESLSNHTSFRTFITEGRANYLRLFGAQILFMILFAVAGVLWVITLFLTVFGTIGAFGTEGVAGIGLGALIAVGLWLLIIGGLMLFLQFYNVAIVVSDTGVLGSFKQSAGIVRRNLASTIGYSIIYWTVNALAFIPGTWLFIRATNQPGNGGMSGMEVVSPMELGLALLFMLLVGTVVSGFLYVYHVAFYTQLTASAPHQQNSASTV